MYKKTEYSKSKNIFDNFTKLIFKINDEDG